MNLKKILYNALEKSFLHLGYDTDDIILTFEKLIDKMKPESRIFINIDDIGCNKFLSQTKFKNFISFFNFKFTTM